MNFVTKSEAVAPNFDEALFTSFSQLTSETLLSLTKSLTQFHNNEKKRRRSIQQIHQLK